MPHARHRTRLANLLVEYRAASLLSQVELAALLAVAELTVIRWETGEQVPRPNMLRRLAAALELDDDQAAELGVARATLVNRRNSRHRAALRNLDGLPADAVLALATAAATLCGGTCHAVINRVLESTAVL